MGVRREQGRELKSHQSMLNFNLSFVFTNLTTFQHYSPLSTHTTHTLCKTYNMPFLLFISRFICMVYVFEYNIRTRSTYMHGYSVLNTYVAVRNTLLPFMYYDDDNE